MSGTLRAPQTFRCLLLQRAQHERLEQLAQETRFASEAELVGRGLALRVILVADRCRKLAEEWRVVDQFDGGDLARPENHVARLHTD